MKTTEKAIERRDELQRQLSRTDRRLRAAVEERPLVALAVAVGTGFLLGRLIGRR